MQMHFFGDSYDIVKLSLLHWLRSFGKWSVHPMFTEEDLSLAQIKAYESLLGARVISHEVLRPDSDRVAYFKGASSCGHLFLDPDTGLRMRGTRGKRGCQYLFTGDLLRLTEQRPRFLTIIFDQSVRRGFEEDDLRAKLQNLCRLGVLGFAYVSHACFIVVGRDRTLIERARARVIIKSRLPEKRFLAMHPQ